MVDCLAKLPESVFEMYDLDPETALAILHMDAEEGSELLSMQFAIVHALYFFCHNYHAGQYTRLYQIGSTMESGLAFRMSPCIGCIEDCEEDDQFAYALLENWYNAHGDEFDDSLKGGGLAGACRPRGVE